MARGAGSVFERVYTVELDSLLYRRAQRLFQHDDRVQVFFGDSAQILPCFLQSLDEPALFWLDAHYSGGFTARGATDTPVLTELEHILSHTVAGHVILIDDARCFTGYDHYPTLPNLCAFVKSFPRQYSIVITDDIIRIIPTLSEHSGNSGL
jgi:hypothetical protein